jgi:hypothetical protein
MQKSDVFGVFLWNLGEKMGIYIVTSEKFSTPPSSYEARIIFPMIGTVMSVGYGKDGNETCFPNQLYVMDESNAFIQMENWDKTNYLDWYVVLTVYVPPGEESASEMKIQVQSREVHTIPIPQGKTLRSLANPANSIS